MMSDLEDMLSSLESKVQMLVMRYTQLNDENQNLLARVDDLTKQNTKQNDIINSLKGDKKNYEYVKDNIKEKIQDLISNISLDTSFDDNDANDYSQKIKINNNEDIESISFENEIFANSNINFVADEDN